MRRDRTFDTPPLVFLDTTALKFASERIIRGRVRPSTGNWGGQKVTWNVTQFVEVFPNASARPELQKEIRHLPFIAYLAKAGRLRLTTHLEVLSEFWKLPKTDDPRGRFYDAPIENAPNPFVYSRLVAGWGLGKRDLQFEFVASITHPRFEQLKKAVGAHPESGTYRNQLLDAFHILCAETAGADYFLTLDQKLLRHISQHKRWPPKVNVIPPSRLVSALLKQRRARLLDVLRYARAEWVARRKRPDNGLEDFVQLGKRLEKKGYFDDR